MRPLTEAWISLARVRRRRGRPARERWLADRDAWVRRHAPGKSFADIGGLLDRDGGRAFDAEAAGAERVTLFDAGDPIYGFEQAREQRGSAVRFVQGDLADPVAVERVGPHQVVWCTGVIYHTPDPVLQLRHLRSITTELLFLGTHTIPEVPGLPQACVYYPHLDTAARAALARAYPNRGAGVIGVGTAFDETPMKGHANFWWGITPSALEAMVRSAGFEVVEVWRNHAHPWWTDMVCRPSRAKPLLPPVSYYRERAEARERGEELPWLDYYDR